MNLGGHYATKLSIVEMLPVVTIVWRAVVWAAVIRRTVIGGTETAS